MDNFFVRGLEPKSGTKSPLINLINKGLRYFNTGYSLQRQPDPVADMTTIEQRINYFHLLESIIVNKVPGDLVELGCFTGQCAMIFQQVIQMHNSEKKLHVFDSFEAKFRMKKSVEDTLINNFKNAELTPPIIHRGYFDKTVPYQLPDAIAFAHIDCGFGGNPLAHKQIVIECLEAIYPRMSKNAICVLMDYQNKSVINTGFNPNPGVKLACDHFFASKPEQIIALYGGHYYHGYFRKGE